MNYLLYLFRPFLNCFGRRFLCKPRNSASTVAAVKFDSTFDRQSGAGRGTTGAEVAQGEPTQSRLLLIILVYENKPDGSVGNQDVFVPSNS